MKLIELKIRAQLPEAYLLEKFGKERKNRNGLKERR